MTTQNFSEEFHALIQKSLQANVPVPFMVMQFEMCKLEIGNMHLMAIRNQQAMEMAKQMSKDAPKIISPNSN